MGGGVGGEDLRDVAPGQPRGEQVLVEGPAALDDIQDMLASGDSVPALSSARDAGATG